MSWLTRLSAAVFGQPASIGDDRGWLVRMLGGGPTKAGVEVNEHAALYLPAVYACVNRISNPIARFPLRIFKPKPGGGAEEVTDHPLSLGLRPNPFMSSRTVRKTAMGHALRWGNGYLEIERNADGQAVGLWPLLPDRTAPIRQGDDLLFRTNISGSQHEIPAGNVLHVMDQSQDGYRGLSQIALARQAIGMGLAMEEFGAKFFANDAKSGGFLMHPGRLSTEAKSNIRSARNAAAGGNERADLATRTDPGAELERQGGLTQAHRVKVLEEGMKFISTTIPPEDAQFLGSREFQIAEIARMYDVPLVLLQSHEKSTSWGSGIEQLMIGFVRQTIDPWVDAWEQEMNWKLFTAAERERGYYVKFNMNAYLRGDMAGRAAFYQAMFQVGGLSPNQVLAFEEMEGVGTAGDHHFVPANMTTLAKAIAANAEPPPPRIPATSRDGDSAPDANPFLPSPPEA